MATVIQPIDIPESGADVVGAAGHLVAAALQTAGVFFQSDILKFCGPLFSSVGVLIFVATAMTIFARILARGSLMQAGLAVMGPVLFYFVLGTVTTGHTTRVTVGERTDPNAPKDEQTLLDRLGDPAFYGGTPKVSFVFARADSVITAVMQKIVSVLLDTKNGADLRAAVREDIMNRVFSQRGIDQELMRMISLGLIGECGEYTRRSEEKATLMREIDTATKRGDPKLGQLQADLVAITARIANLKTALVPIDSSTAMYLSRYDQKYAQAQFMSCQEVWDSTWLVLQAEADSVLTAATNGDTTLRGIPWADVKTDVAQAISSNRPELTTKILAAYLLKNTVSQGPHEGLVDTLASASPYEARNFNIIARRLALTEGEGSLISLHFFAGVIPYFQGLLLFLLAAAFPFFCFFLLMPSRIGSFFLWFALWTWVKSWDVGFAFVTIVRQMLWPVFNVRTVPNAALGDFDDLTTVFQVIEQYDPFTHLGVYYTIISILTLAVPVVTAHLCLGANDLLGAFRTGIDRTAQKFHNRHAHGVRRQHASLLEQRMYFHDQMKALEDTKDWAANGQAMGPDGQPLTQRGDNAMPQAMDTHYSAKAAGYHFDKEGVENFSDLAMFATRPVAYSFSSQISGQAGGESVLQETQKYESPQTIGSHNRAYIPGVSEKPSNFGPAPKLTSGSSNTQDGSVDN